MKSNKILLFLIILLCGIFLVPLSSYAATDISESNEKISITVEPAYSNYTGNVIKPTITVTHKKMFSTATLKENTDYYVKYYNDENCTKECSPKDKGQYYIKIIGKGSYTGSQKKTFRIYARKLDPNDNKLLCYLKNGPVYEYTGAKIEPEVYVSYNGKKLEEGIYKDYTVGYSDNKNLGTGTVQVSGHNNFFGYIDLDFRIVHYLSDGNGKLSLSETEWTYTADYIKPPVTVKYGGTRLTKDIDYSVAYYDNKTVGTATVSVQGIGKYDGFLTTTFKIKPLSLSEASINCNEVYYYTGDEIKPNITVKSPANKTLPTEDYSVDYFNNTNIGKAKIKITAYSYNCYGTNEKEFDIKYNIEDATASLSSTSFEYTGEEIEPTVVVKKGTTLLKEGTDYWLAYYNNTNVGTAKVKIFGEGDYAGTTEKTFTITARSLDSDKTMVYLKESKYEYTGEQIKPEITAKYGDTTLIKGTDYDIKYGTNKNPGKAAGTIKIEAKKNGNYKDSKEFTFNIEKGSLENTIITLDKKEGIYEYTGKKITPKVTVKTSKGKTLSSRNDYDIEGAEKVNVGTYIITIKGKEKGNWAGTNSTTFMIKYPIKASTTKITLKNENFIYTGEAIKPEILSVIYNKNMALVEGKDYEVSYSVYNGRKYNECKLEDIKNVGTYKVTLTGKNNCNGTVEKTFKITACSLKSDKTMVYLKESKYEYTGEQIRPEITAQYGNTTLIKGTDYTIDYGTNKNAGEGAGTIIIKGMTNGNYKDSMTFTFNIEKCPLEKTTISLDKKDNIYYYTGKEIKPKITVKTSAGKQANSKEYSVEYSENIKVGTHTITIKGKDNGNFTGKNSTTFMIKYNIKKYAKAILSANEYTYTGNVIVPTPDNEMLTVMKMNGNEELTIGKDYVLDHINNKNVGKATVKIIGRGDYTGTIDKDFKITACSLDSEKTMVYLKESKYEYTGLQITPEITAKYGDTTLIKGTDYDIKYGTNKNAGEGAGTITITAKKNGNYKSSKMFTFTIDPCPMDSNSIEVSINNISTKTARSINTLSTNTAKSTLALNGSVVTANAVTTNATTDNNEDSNIDVSMKHAILPYTGKAVDPKVKVQKHGDNWFKQIINLIFNKDYTIKYYSFNRTNNEYEECTKNDIKDIGKYQVKIIGGGSNFKGERTEDFAIRGSINNAEIKIGSYTENGFDETDIFTYTGSEIKPSVLVKYKGETLKEGEDEDFTVTYSDNIDVNNGKSKVVVTLADFEDSYEKSFTINPYSIVDKDGKIDEKINVDVSAKGDVEIEFENAEGKKVQLIKGIDFNPIRIAEKSVFTDKVSIRGKGNFKGTIEEFEFETIEDKEETFEYTGEEIKPKVTIYQYGDVDILQEDVDYEIQYENNINITDNAKMIIKSKKTNENPRTINFKIEAASLAKLKNLSLLDITVKAYKSEGTYDGGQTAFTKPIVSIIHKTKKLQEDVDYEVKYEESGIVKIQGLGNYKEEIEEKCQYDSRSLEKEIWSRLRNHGYTAVQAAGIMANIEYESGYKTNKLENTYKKALGYTDQSYTDAVNSGAYSRQSFISDHKEEGLGAGYGLIQWSHNSRKGGLYDLAKESGRDIDDFDLQMEYIFKEIDAYPSTSRFKITKSAYEAGLVYATDGVCHWDDPDGSMAHQRAATANEIFEEFKEFDELLNLSY